jgi:glycine/D-amino acid oxidase-like deaminating enzyme
MKPLSAVRDLPPSLWAATAIEAPDTPALLASRQADVVIIGGGYMGLSTALHLAERGADVCVVEASQPGWGASGRNGGQVIPGLKYDPDELIAMFGAGKAEPIIRTMGNAADDVFDLIGKYDIRCDAIRSGWIQPAHSDAAMTALVNRARQWEKRGAKVEILDHAAVSDRIGTDEFVGGWVDYRAGSIQPLSYARGMASAAIAQGAAIHGNTLVTDLKQVGNRWQITTSTGLTVTANRVVIATNAYSGNLWPGLRETMIAANSFIVATRPLPEQAARSILRGGEVCSDSRRLLLYFRRDAHNRLLMGGRGIFKDPVRPDDWSHLEQSVRLKFPQLKDVEYEFRWAGRVALTRDFLPHVHEPAPGIVIAVGCNGRGIALATTLGKHLAARMLGAPDAEFPFPLCAIKPIPLHGLQRFYIAAGVTYYRLLDMVS